MPPDRIVWEQDVLALLDEINHIKPVWVELGLQTIHPETSAYIRRGYELSVFEQAVKELRAIGITVIVHTILYLPGETKDDMLDTIHYLNHMDIQGIKLQLLHVLTHTDLAADYEKHPFYIPDMQDYIQFSRHLHRTVEPRNRDSSPDRRRAKRPFDRPSLDKQ